MSGLASPLLLGLYALIAGVNLVSAALFRDTPRAVAKCLLVPALVALYLVAAPRVLVWVVLALAFCWLGDVLLLRKTEPKFFRLGLAAFLIGHIFYIVAFMVLAGGIAVLPLLISLVIAIASGWALLRFIEPSDQMRVPVTAYAVVILLMSMAALQLMLGQPGWPGVLVFISALVFMYSDSQMAYLLFHKQPRYFNVITMVPYILAQAGIVVGLVSLAS